MRILSAYTVLAVCLILAALPSPAPALTLKEAADALVTRLWSADPPGDVLFSERFEGDLGQWTPDKGWSIVDNPDGGKCARVTSSDEDNEDLILKQHIPVVPGHPIAVCFKTRFVSGGDPLYLRVDFFDAEGKTGKPYARQEQSHEGPQWIENTLIVSDWFPEYTRALTIWFHHVPKANTTSLLSDIRVVDLARPAGALVAAELPKYRALNQQLSRAVIPKTPVAQAWQAIISQQSQGLAAELAACEKLEPGSEGLDRRLGKPATYLTRLTEAVAGLKSGAVTTQRLLAYSTRPVSSQMVLPNAPELPGARLGKLALTACAGETESASLVLWAPDTVRSAMVKLTDLKGSAGTLPAASAEVHWVKCWYQAGTAPRGVTQDRLHKVLVPELLLHDDSLVRVDLESRHNELKLSFPTGPRYVSIDDPTPPNSTWGSNLKFADFPVEDAAALQPTDLPAGQNRQVWITVTVPATAKPGLYQGKVMLTASGAALGEVPISLQVLPFSLPAPLTRYDLTQPFTGSLYYWGELDRGGEGGIGYKLKSEQQFRAELKLMYDHGIVAPAVIWSPGIVYKDEAFFRRHLQIMRDIGMSNRPLYFADSSVIGAPTEPAALEELKANIAKTIRIAAEYGFTGVYFYGIDEARDETLKAERVAWGAVHEAGGKVIVSGFHGQFEAVGDLLDLFNRCGEPAADSAARWHDRGHKIWNYANPQTPAEDPEMYRRNYGLYLWRLDYDGTCTYCFMDSSGTQWNDFDDDTYRDHCLAYPTVDGVVGTLALEGFREGQDDLRYVTALRLLIEKAKTGPAAKQAQAEQAIAWLDALDMRTADLDTVRGEIIRWIGKLGG